MFEGVLVAIYVCDRAKAPMTSVPRVKAFAGRGLEGDRNCAAEGAVTKRPGDQVTLIEEEAVAAVTAETKTPLSAAETRRNLVTRGEKVS